jgi:hypothetical protein
VQLGGGNLGGRGAMMGVQCNPGGSGVAQAWGHVSGNARTVSWLQQRTPPHTHTHEHAAFATTGL